MSEPSSLRVGERRNVTVLFADMKDFTSLSERLDPEEVDGLISTVFDLFTHIIQRYDGSVEKYIGDALVAVFGAPRMHEDDAARAVNAALEFLHELKVRSLGVTFRIGIHSGLIATGKRGAYEVVTGHAVSVASRLQAAAPDAGVLVSEATREMCGTEFLFDGPVALQVKGKSESIVTYRVAGRSFKLLQYATAFVGRDTLVSDMVAAYLHHDARSVSGYCITGEGGIGKTRTVAEFARKVAQFPEWDAPFLYSRARRFKNLPFAVVNDLVLGYFHVDSQDEPSRIAELVASGLDIDSGLADRFASLVTGLAQQSEGSTFAMLHTILDRIIASASGKPYAPICFIDNIHTVDRQSRDFFRYFLDNAASKPFFLLAGRAEGTEVQRIFAGLRSVPLPPLTSAESMALIQSNRDLSLDESLTKQVLSNAAGNPLFIEEYLSYVRTHDAEQKLPPSIENIFLASVDTYEPSMQELLKKLSVFERSFGLDDARFLQERTEGSSDGVQAVVSFFVRQGHLVEAESGYHFRHDLFRRTLYNSLLNFNKKVLHSLVAERIRQQQQPNRLRLLHHLACAEKYAELREELFKDPRYEAVYDYVQYVDVLLSATNRDDPEYYYLLFVKYAILSNAGRTEGSESILNQLVAYSIEKKNVEFLARVYHILSANYLLSNSFANAMMCGRRAIHYYQQVDPNHRSLQNARLHYATAALLSNNIDENQRVIDEMKTEDHSHSFDNRTCALVERHFYLGDYRTALSELLLCRRQGIPDQSPFWYDCGAMLASVYFRMFDGPHLKPLCLELLEAEGQPPSFYMNINAMLSVSLILSNEPADAEGYLRKAEFYSYQVNNDYHLVHVIRSLALAHYVIGNREKAEEIALRGARAALRHAAFYHQFGLVILLVELYTSMSAEQDARFFLKEADFIVDQNPLLNNQELMLYYYFKYRYDVEQGGRRHLEKGAALLEEEKRRLADPELVRAFLSSRIYRDLATEAARLQEIA